MTVATKTRTDALREGLEEHSLKREDVILSNGASSSYYVDAKQALLRPEIFRVTGELIAAKAIELGASAVGGMTLGADPLACAAISSDGDDGLLAFFVRKQKKDHGLQRWIEGPELSPGTLCLVVDDVVTTGASTISAIDRVREDGLDVIGALCVLDRLAGGGEAIAAKARVPFFALTTINDVYPDRPDR